jgi:peptidyl-prolyl cis-trans isomerase A (cyclophilin A)
MKMTMMKRLIALLAIGLPTLAHAQPSGSSPHGPSAHPALTDPRQATETAPDSFDAKFETSKGDVIFACTREWAPHGVDRFYNLIKIGFFDDMALFRVKKGFVVQWGIHGTPEVAAAWQTANLPVDPVKQSNTRGMLTYAMAGSPTTRSTQLFINYGNNANLDRMGFAPICKVSEGSMAVTEQFYGGYDEQLTSKQGEIQAKGNAYLRAEWPELDYIKRASIVGDAGSPAQPAAQPAQEEGSNTTIIVVVVAALAIGAFVLLRRKDDDAPQPKADKPQPKHGAKKRTGKRAGGGKKKAAVAQPPSKKKKKKKRDTGAS